LTRQVVGLVEPATDRTNDVQRDGHDGVSVCDYVVASLTEDDTQRLGQQPPTFVFERVNELAQRAVVPSRATRNRECRRIGRAALAAIRQACGSGQFVAADLTERRGDGFNMVPAVVTDRASEWRVQ